MSRDWSDEQIQFMVWLATPKKLRDPKTQDALAKQLGYTPEQLSRWKRYPDWNEAALAYRKNAVTLEDYQGVMAALIRQAKKQEGSTDRKTFLTWMGEMKQHVDITSDGKGFSWASEMVEDGSE